MSIVLFFLIALLLFLLGLAIALLFNKGELLEVWALSWFLGMGWGTMSWFLAYHLGQFSFTLASLFATLASSNLLTWLIVLLIRPQSLNMLKANSLNLLPTFLGGITKSPPLLKIGWLILGLLFLFIFVQDIFWPVTDWDALALYDFRAKVMVETGSLAQGKELEYFFQYPLFTSILHAATYLTNLGIAKFWYALIYHISVVLFYTLLRKKTTAELSLIGALFFATSPLIFFHSFMAYTNLAYSVYGCFGFIYLWLWWADDEINNLILGSMLVGLSTWIRISEPFYYVAVIVVLAGALKKIYHRQLSLKLTFALFISLLLIWKTRVAWDSLIVALYGVNLNTPLNTLTLIHERSFLTFIKRTEEVTTYLWKYSLPVYGWYLLIGLGLFIIDLKNKKYQVIFPWLTIASLLGIIFLGTLLLSFWLESWNRIGDSVARMSLFLVPLLIYIIFSSPSWLQLRKGK